MEYFINKKKNNIMAATAVLLVLIVVTAVIIWPARSGRSSSATNKQQANENESSYSEKCSLKVRVGMDKKVAIPDPASAEGEVTVSLLNEPDSHKAKYLKNYLADLSFAGFKNPVFVSAYVAGDITGEPDTVTHIYRQTKNGVKENEVSGSCLALFVTTGLYNKLEKAESIVCNCNCYFVILDYKNGICYKKKTSCFLHYFHWLDMSLADLTGDGKEELIASQNTNKSIDFWVYRADVDKHNIKEVYSTDTDYDKNGEFLDRREFKGVLHDNYKVTLKFPCIGYSKTVSMIKDGGYKKSELQKKTDQWGSIINLAGMWKNGKLLKKWAKKHGMVFLYTLDVIAFVKSKEGTIQIDLIRPVCVGHRSESIGGMHTYLEYNKDLDTLIIKDAKYSDYETTYSEWKTESFYMH